jgi:hypothetical protein
MVDFFLNPPFIHGISIYGFLNLFQSFVSMEMIDEVYNNGFCEVIHAPMRIHPLSRFARKIWARACPKNATYRSISQMWEYAL